MKEDKELLIGGRMKNERTLMVKRILLSNYDVKKSTGEILKKNIYILKLKVTREIRNKEEEED